MVRRHAPNMFDTAGQTNKTSPIKHENKRNVLSCLIECLMAFKFYQTQSNSTKQGGQTVKCLDAKHVPFGHALKATHLITLKFMLPAAKAKNNESGNNTMSNKHQMLRNSHQRVEALNATRRSPCHLSFTMSSIIGWSKNCKTK